MVRTTHGSVWRSALKQALHHPIAEQRIVGGVLLLSHKGVVIHADVAGVIDYQTKQPVQRHTPFRIASLTKLVTAVTALRLCELGQLDLESPITRWLPYFTPALSGGRIPVITVRHLLTHTAGLSYGFEMPVGNVYEKAGISDGLDNTQLTLYDNLQRLAKIPLQFSPGSAWQYSIATDVLGAILECAADTHLPTLVERYVTHPLGMTTTSFSAPTSSPLATPYRDCMEGGKAIPIGSDDWLVLDTGRARVSADRAYSRNAWPSGGAGLISNADDYLKLLECVRQGGAPILSLASTQALVGNAIAPLSIRSRGPGWGFGLGPLVLTNPTLAKSPQNAGTWSWCGLFGSHYWVDPVAELSMVAMTNTGVAGAWGDFANAILTAIYCQT